MRITALVAALLVAAGPLSPAMAARMDGYTVRSTMMLAGPDGGYPAVRRMGGNAGVLVYGCLRDWSWCDVSYRADRGWIAGNDLVVNYRGRRQTIAPSMGIGILSFVFGSYWDSHYRSRPFYSQRPRFEQQYNSDHRPQWGQHPQAPVIAPRRNLPDRGVMPHQTAMPQRQAPVRAPRVTPQQHQPVRRAIPVQRPDMTRGQPPRAATQRQPAPARQPRQARPSNAGHGNAGKGNAGNGNRGNAQAPGPQRGGRGGAPGKPNQNQRPSD